MSSTAFLEYIYIYIDGCNKFLAGCSVVRFKNPAKEHPGKVMKPRRIPAQCDRVITGADIGDFTHSCLRAHNSLIRLGVYWCFGDKYYVDHFENVNRHKTSNFPPISTLCQCLFKAFH